MRLLQRYVLIELLKVFFATLAIITMFMVLVGMYREAHDQVLGLGQIIPLIPYLLPQALQYAIPATILLAVCSVYGRMSGTNELVAIKSLGISPMVVLWPAFLFTFLLSLFAVWLNDGGVIWGKDQIQRIIVEKVEDIAYSMLQTQRSYSNKRFAINIKGIEGRKLLMPVVTFEANADSPAVTVTAKEAEIRADSQARTLSILFRDCTIDVDGQGTLYMSDQPFERIMPLEDASRMSRSSSPSYTPMNDIPGEVAKRREQIARMELDHLSLASFQLLTGDFDTLSGDTWKALDQRLRDERAGIHRLNTEPTRRWANGFSCLCFVLIGAPLAIRWRNTDLMTTFGLCFVPILLLYYPLLTFGLDAAKRGSLPPHIVWLGNVILAAGGLWLMRKVIRY